MVVEIPLLAKDNKTIRAWTLIDDEDEEFVSQWIWRYQPASRQNKTGYASRREWIENGSKHIFLHRILIEAPDEDEVDHIDRDGLNNQKINLRFATRSQNSANRSTQLNNTTGYKGVQRQNKGYRAAIEHGEDRITIGYFTTPEDAAYAYNLKATEIFGEYAYLNELPERYDPSTFKNLICRNNNKIGYRGVNIIDNRHARNPFKAQIQYKGGKIHLGSFPTAEDAARAYNAKAMELFRDKAKLNIIQTNSNTQQ